MKKITFTKKKVNKLVSSIFAFTLFSITTGHTQTITTVAGVYSTTGSYGGDNGPATDANLNYPSGIAVDRAGNVYIADYNNIRIRKVDAGTGNINTVVGTGTDGYSPDGSTAANAAIGYAVNVALDATGNLYLHSNVNGYDTIIQKVNASGILNKIAGNGAFGYSGDNGPAIDATISEPEGMAFDAAGNFYFVDENDNVVRKISTSGVITTVVGNGTSGYSGDGGQATNAQLYLPSGIAINAAGDLYVCDYNMVVRKVDHTTKTITTVVGDGSASYYGDGGPATDAELNNPQALALDTAGNLYIADAGNNVIRRVDAATQTITTFAGNGTSYGDNIAAANAILNQPFGLAFDATGSLYVSDAGTNRIRKITFPAPPCTTIIAGTISGSDTGSFCGTGTDTLSLVGTTVASSLSYQWQSSIDGNTWANVGTDTTVYATGTFNTTIYYRNVVTCLLTSDTSTSSIDTLIVNPIVAPTISISANPGNNIGLGQSVTFNASTSGGGSNPTYQWLINGVVISGATDSAYTSRSLADNDTITCIIHSNAPCADTNAISSNTIVMHVGSSVKSIAGIKNLSLYPNPNSGQFTLSGSFNSDEATTLEVMDLTGRTLQTLSTIAKNGSISKQVNIGNNCASGMYLLRLTNSNGSNTIPFTIAKQ